MNELVAVLAVNGKNRTRLLAERRNSTCVALRYLLLEIGLNG